MSYFQIKGRETERNTPRRDSQVLKTLWDIQSGTKFTIDFKEIGPGSGYDRDDWGKFVIFKANGKPPLEVESLDVEIYEDNRKLCGYDAGNKIFSSLGENFEVTMKKTLLQTTACGFNFDQRIYTFTPTKVWRTAKQRYAFMGANAELDRRRETGQPLPDYVPPAPGQLDGQMFNANVTSRDLHRNIAEYLGGGKRKSIRSLKRKTKRKRNNSKKGGSRKKRTTRNNRK